MPEAQRTVIDSSVPHIARVYNYWLGGKDNYAVDRDLAEKFIEADPAAVQGVRSNRAFLGRAVEFLAAEAGIRQFLDIGTGIPTADNTHEVAQRCAPDSRIVYVDNDPIVLVHARALLTSDPAGVTNYIEADLREVGTILTAAAATLDFTKPIAVMLVGILHCIPDADDPAGIVTRLLDAVPSGSYLTISHPASDIHAEEMARGAAVMNRSLATPVTFRPREQVVRFFDGLHLVEPGIVPTTQWRPRPGADTSPLPGWVGVARKP
jgi:S-adenosyl methyltransferase